jgi:hypothetical protein
MVLMPLMRSTPLFWMPGPTRRVSMIRCFAALIAALVCGPAVGLAQGSVVIRDVTVIPMTGAGPVARQSVVIRNGRIAEIGPSAQIRIPAEASMSAGAPMLWIVVKPARSVTSAFWPAATTRSSCDSISVGMRPSRPKYESIWTCVSIRPGISVSCCRS